MQYGPGNRKDAGKGCELSTAILLFREDAGTSVTSDGGKKITAADVGGGRDKKEKGQILEKYAHSAGERRQNSAAETASDDNKFRRKNSERRQEICRKRSDSRATIIAGKPNRERRSDVI